MTTHSHTTFGAYSDFSMPALMRPAPDPDADLREACNEYERQRAISNALTSTEEEADAACATVSRLCRQIARTKPTTPLGFAAKARVVAIENDWGRILSGRDLTPFKYDPDAITFSLLADLIQGRPLT